MASLSDFADFVKSTAPAWASSQDAFVNEIQQNSYPLARFLKGREMSDVFQNGERIKDGIILDQPGTFQMISPETESTWTNAQTLTTWEIPWRFAQAHMAWTAQEVELNEGSSAAVWKRVKKIKQTGLANDIVHGLNGKLFARPQASKMESFTADPGEPQSIPALVNEYTNGLFASAYGATGLTVSDRYTSTVQGISPTTKTKWKPVQKTYANFNAASNTNLLASFDDIFLDLQFRQPGTMNEYFENESMFRQVIYTTKSGLVKYKALLRSENDVQVVPGRQDPAYQNPTYSGIPLERAPQLETEALYTTTGSALYDESGATDSFSGPRYYWINANFMKMAFHSNYYFKYLDVFSPEKNRTKYILPIQIWFNLYCTSRRHQGVVSPSADL
jgi:hypothetical protein